MLAFYLYAQFLLVLPSDDCNSKILYILDQVEADQNPFPLILAETIIGLDNFVETRRFFWKSNVAGGLFPSSSFTLNRFVVSKLPIFYHFCICGFMRS